MTVRRLLDELDSEELSEWMAFDRLEPIPDSYWQTGMIASTMSNLWSKGRHTPADFMPARRSPAAPRAQSAAEGQARLRALASAMRRRARAAGG